jgi:hypothetical protein
MTISTICDFSQYLLFMDYYLSLETAILLSSQYSQPLKLYSYRTYTKNNYDTVLEEIAK